MKKIKYLKIFWLITYTLLVGFLLINIVEVVEVLKSILGVFKPFIYGFVLAYILSFPYNFFYNRCFHKIGSKRKRNEGIKKPLALICSYILGFGIIAFLVGILVPELSKSITTLVDDIPMYADSIRNSTNDFVASIRENFGFDLYDAGTYNEIMNFLTGKDAQEVLKNFINDAFPAALNFAQVFTTGLYNWIIGIVVSIYMLASKDKLCRQARAIVVAYFSFKTAKKILQITDLCNKKCGKFIIGKIIDSIIIGIICFIFMTIVRYEYSLLISVIIGVTNVIPFFGPFIGAIPCAFLLLLINPMHGLVFIIFVICLQQLDGNFIGPKILGETVGISGFWILFSVIIGGGLFGIIGMLLGVPVFAVIYTLVDDSVTKRIKEKRSMIRITELSAQLEALEADIPDESNFSESEEDSDNNKEITKED